MLRSREEHQKPSRLGSCEVCDQQAAKYSCPECEVKTCSVPCVNIHKKELSCSGIRNKVKYIPLKKFGNLDLQSDYMLLEEAGRKVDILMSNRNQFHNRPLPLHLTKLKEAASKRGVELKFLPSQFSRRKSNTTFFEWKTEKLFWKIDWVFNHANGLKCSSDRVLDTLTIGEAISNYLCTKKCPSQLKELLHFYHSRGFPGVKVLLKEENESDDKFYVVEYYSTVRMVLYGKTIIENPTFHVVFADHIDEFDLISSDEEADEDADIKPSYFFTKESNPNEKDD